MSIVLAGREASLPAGSSFSVASLMTIYWDLHQKSQTWNIIYLSYLYNVTKLLSEQLLFVPKSKRNKWRDSVLNAQHLEVGPVDHVEDEEEKRGEEEEESVHIVVSGKCYQGINIWHW